MSRQITVMVRTRDEADNIGQFCAAYSEIADKILVADGGSEDNTLEIASWFPKVEIRHFEGRTPLRREHWRNNDSDHINFLIEWAREDDPDWIILDDCDSRPNFMLREHARHELEDTNKSVAMTCRVYLWGKDQYFPHMMHLKPVEEDNYMTSLWAWRPGTNLWTVSQFPHYTLMIGNEIAGDLHLSSKVLDLMPPFCLLHYTWANEERALEKIRIHRESGSIPDHKHPLEFAGPLEPLPRWAREQFV